MAALVAKALACTEVDAKARRRTAFLREYIFLSSCCVKQKGLTVDGSGPSWWEKRQLVALVGWLIGQTNYCTVTTPLDYYSIGNLTR